MLCQGRKGTKTNPGSTGKSNFVETRTFWHIFRSFDRLWTFYILALQVYGLFQSSGVGFSSFYLTMKINPPIAGYDHHCMEWSTHHGNLPEENTVSSIQYLYHSGYSSFAPKYATSST